MKSKVIVLVSVFVLLLAACDSMPAANQEPEGSIQEPMIVPTGTPEPMALDTIVDIAVADGRFTTLVAAVQAAGLVDTLKSEGPFTVFAPTDEAFAKLPAGTVDALLEAENRQQLADILLYHVVLGKVMAAEVVGLDGQSVDTALEGAHVAIAVDGGNVILNGEVMVIITDIEAENGVIHVIDAVLLPPAE
jgi:transforming growth factor-beta-induced protein